jgi:hypothetical protein
MIPGRANAQRILDGFRRSRARARNHGNCILHCHRVTGEELWRNFKLPALGIFVVLSHVVQATE